MVKIKITRNKLGQVYTFHGDGHAEAGEFGSDLVCAAVSAVMQTALLGLGEYAGLAERLTYHIDEDGWLYCKLPADLTAEEQIKVEAITETMLIGLRSIESSYPDNIHVEEEVE